jgi:hypothetical protein
MAMRLLPPLLFSDEAEQALSKLMLANELHRVTLQFSGEDGCGNIDKIYYWRRRKGPVRTLLRLAGAGSWALHDYAPGIPLSGTGVAPLFPNPDGSPPAFLGELVRGLFYRATDSTGLDWRDGYGSAGELLIEAFGTGRVRVSLTVNVARIKHDRHAFNLSRYPASRGREVRCG